MSKVKFKGPGVSYSYGNYRFIRDTDSAVQEVPEKVSEALIATGRFETVRGGVDAEVKVVRGKRPGITIKTGGALPDLKEGQKPEWPADGFKDKRDLEAYARKYLGYEADLRKALKTLNADARAVYGKLFLEEERAAAEEHPEDLFDDDELNTTVEAVVVVDNLEDVDDDADETKGEAPAPSE